ncbi:AsmA family protein [Rhizobium oryzicola]|uniref:AsmA family protein n=1 Tax=Rhizobium oryzicola TaxID=1232668 RepID=A0ABT8T219_9HYPH|nr:AsmA family protein [Rhizobium oryzicola]MDO1584464.1 AsmA family protein [Rhizobium oryzicola]
MLGRIFLFLGGLVVVALFTALLAPFFVDWSSFRTEFESQASRILGKKVTVHGTVDARLLPFPSVTMHDVRVGQDLDGTPLVQVAQFSMDMELAPFLSGEARIIDMRIDRPKARIRLLKDGRLDWMRGSRPEIPARTVVLEGVHVSNAEIDFIDDGSGRTRRLTSLTAEMSASSLAGPWRAEGNATLDGYEGKFTFSSGEPDYNAGTMPLRMKIWPDIQPIEVQLDGALAVTEGRPGYQGAFNLLFTEEPAGKVQPATAQNPGQKPPAPPRVKGKFELTNDRIRIPDYRVELGVTDDPYVITGEATLDTGDKPEFLLTADGQQVDVNRLTDQMVNGKTGRDPRLSAHRRLNALIELAARVPVPQVPGRATLRLPAVVVQGTTIRDVRLNLRPAKQGWAVDNAVAILPGRTQVEAQGMLRLTGAPSFIGKMLLASNQPSGLADWLSGQIDPAIRQLKAAGFSASVNLTPEIQRFEQLELAIGPATLKGRVERQSPPERTPNLTLDLAGNEIDIDALRALASLLTGDDAGQDVLDHRLAAHLKADRLTAFGIAAKDVDTVLSLGNGAMSVDRLTVGDLAGARITAKGKAEGSILSYTGNGSVTFSAADPSAFFAMLRDNLPRHPALDRLVRNAEWYKNSQLSASISLGDWVSASIGGMSNGSQVAAQVQLSNLFDLTQDVGIEANATLQNPEAAPVLGQLGLDPLPIGGEGAAKATVKLSRNGTKPAQAEIAYENAGTQLTAKGEIALDGPKFGEGQGDVSLKSNDLEPTLAMLGAHLPEFGAGLPVELEAHLSLAENRLGLGQLSGNVAGNRLQGDVTIDRGLATTAVSGSLAIGSIDLGWLAEAVYGPLTDPATGAWTETDFAKPILSATDFSLDLKADSFHAPSLPAVSRFTARLATKSGGIALENAGGDWLGGKVSGRAAMSNGGGVGLFQTRLTIENADLASLVWHSAAGPVAQGRVSGDLVAEATAKTVAGLIDAASGSGTMKLSGLVLPRVNQSLLPGLLADADGLQGDVTEAKVLPLVARRIHDGAINLGDVDVPFTITGGRLRAQNIAARSGETTVSGNLDWRLRPDTLTGSVELGYAAGPEAIAGGDPSIRLVYNGDIAQPSEALDISSMTNFLSLRASEQQRRRVETLQASVLEKQRLRREVALYTFRQNERRVAKERADAEERARQAEQIRLQAENERRQREQQQRDQQQPTLTVPPTGDLFRNGAGFPGNQSN